MRPVGSISSSSLAYSSILAYSTLCTAVKNPRLTKLPGIGRGAAHKLAENGIKNLVLADINESTLDSARTELLALHPALDILTLQTNVVDETSVAAAVQKSAEKYGRVDITINSAGISGTPCPTDQLALAEWQKVIDVNQTGLFLCQRAAIQQMLTQE